MKYVTPILICVLIVILFLEYSKNITLTEKVTLLTEENEFLIQEVAKAQEVEKELKARQLELSTAINKYAKRSANIKKDKVIQDLIVVRDNLKQQSEKLDSIGVNYPNRVDEDLIKSLKYKLGL